MADPKLGLALGSGAARGWAHIGVLQVLAEAGIKPDIICGTSVGALVGAAFLTDQIDPLLAWSDKMGLFGILGMLDLTFSRGGLVATQKAFDRFRNVQTEILIENLPDAFGAVATDLASGREIWLRDGSLLDAVQASVAMPGLFPAVRRGEQWLVDGALVNPVPVSLCRAMGADIVIAVNLNSHMPARRRPLRHRRGPAAVGRPEADNPLIQMTSQWAQQIRARFSDLTHTADRDPSPSVLDIVARSVDIMQDRITRSRLAGEPPEVLISPRLGHVGILEFERVGEVIAIGRAAAQALLPAIEIVLRR
ncbi:MAG: patatin-like phospholipase family protein [Azospirillaceae bacterium]|nr:patatin-like phospholipase family protein [Azospirillaceae bacterium]